MTTTQAYYCYYPSPVGPLLLAGDGHNLWRIAFACVGGQALPLAKAGIMNRAQHWRQAPEQFTAVTTQLDAYFAGTRTTFDLALAPQGTDFQQAVWRALQAIPYGQTSSYQAIAQAIGRPRAARAVGQANNHNPLPIVIPCHRVIGADGGLVGFAPGLPVKRFLLRLEGVPLP